MTFVDGVLDVHDALDRGGIPHAFGGALALAYVAEPRGTVGIDVNVFLPAGEIDRVVAAVRPLGYELEAAVPDHVPVAGIKVVGDRFPLDLFPSLDESYAGVERRVVHHPFGPERRPLPFLSPEDLAMFKLSFGRDKDWVDLRSIARSGTVLDLDLIEANVVALRGPTMYPRVARLRQLVRSP